MKHTDTQRRVCIPYPSNLVPVEELKALEAYKAGTLEKLQKVDTSRPQTRHPDSILPTFDVTINLFSTEESEEMDEIPSRCANAHLIAFKSNGGQSSNDVWETLRTRAYHESDVWASHPGEIEWHENVIRHGYLSNPKICFLDLLQYKCRLAQVRHCQLKRCLSLRDQLDHVLPKCEKWPNFRTWVLAVSSCQLCMASAGYRWVRNFSFAGFQRILDAKGPFMSKGDLELLTDIYELLYFAMSQVRPRVLQLVKDTSAVLEDTSWAAWWAHRESLPRQISLDIVKRATEKATRLQICPNRLWNLTYSAGRGQHDLLALIKVVEKAPRPESFAHKGHSQCSAEFCQFTDENSTLKEQAHKCGTLQTCQIIHFPIEQLTIAVLDNHPTVWPTRNLLRAANSPISLSPYPEKYIAISHVWSDGTGVGVGRVGEVNECLVRYFMGIADDLGCDGIWWDTVCIPMQRQAKRKALSNMQQNYANAYCTVIHDEYLLQVDWATDGSPSLALLLSPWFTRGWTALELSMSESVKVIFRDPENPRKHLLKDLDKDVLAEGFTNPGYYAATAQIQQLRGGQPTLHGLLKSLSIRTTSWARDRICIAALLSRVDGFDYDDSQRQTTLKIMKTYREIPRRLLLHGHTTLKDRGPFSWCPNNLLYSEVALLEDRDPFDVAYIDLGGAVCGEWFHKPVDRRNFGALQPYSFHPSVEMRIKEELQNWSHCMILSEHSYQIHHEPVLLVATSGAIEATEEMRQLGFDRFIDCHYIGCVIDLDDNNAYGVKIAARIGCEASKPSRDAKVVRHEYRPSFFFEHA